MAKRILKIYYTREIEANKKTCGACEHKWGNKCGLFDVRGLVELDRYGCNHFRCPACLEAEERGEGMKCPKCGWHIFFERDNEKQSRIDALEAEIKRLREEMHLASEPTSGICMKYQIQNCGVCDNIYCSDNTSAAKDAIRTLESTLRSEQTKREDMQRLNSRALDYLKRKEFDGYRTGICPDCHGYKWHESECERAALIKELEAK
jgi:DNA-directed RNA polymerase subunit RPC12/RpoP